MLFVLHIICKEFKVYPRLNYCIVLRLRCKTAPLKDAEGKDSLLNSRFQPIIIDSTDLCNVLTGHY